MNSIYKNLILSEAKNLIIRIKTNKEYNSFANDLEYFINLQNAQINNSILNELETLISRIKKLLELDSKIKEKEDIIMLFENISTNFKEQQIREDDLSKISNGEIFKLVEEFNLYGKKEIKDLDLIFITREGANKYKKEHENEYKGTLKIKIIDNKDILLEKILRIIEKNY